MSRSPGDSLELNLPRQHGWLLLAPAVDVVGLLLLFPLLLRGFVAESGVAIAPPSSEFVLEDFDQALRVWLPAGDGPLRCNGREIQPAELDGMLTAQRQAGVGSLVLHADRAAAHQRVMAITDAALRAGFQVGYATLPAAVPAVPAVP